MKNKLLCLLCVGLLLGTCACGDNADPPAPEKVNRTYVESEVLTAAASLIDASVEINEMLYGTGIPVKSGDDVYTEGVYVEADATYLSEHGVDSLDTLRQKTKAVYAEEACETLFRVLEIRYDTNGGIIGYKRYYESATEGCIMVNPAADVYFSDTVTYHKDTLRVEKSDGEYVLVTIGATVTQKGGASQERTLSLSLLEEADGWRLATVSGASYSEYFNR